MMSGVDDYVLLTQLIHGNHSPMLASIQVKRKRHL